MQTTHPYCNTQHMPHSRFGIALPSNAIAHPTTLRHALATRQNACQSRFTPSEASAPSGLPISSVPGTTIMREHHRPHGASAWEGDQGSSVRDERRVAWVRDGNRWYGILGWGRLGIGRVHSGRAVGVVSLRVSVDGAVVCVTVSAMHSI